MTSLSLAVRVHLADALVWAHARHLIAAAAVAGHRLNAVTARWAQSPANRCIRPGCPRCRRAP
ncbi:hypothetical protein Pta02_51040 [Planobispora takensis]|uniref:Uncharacterized protein n=1 Tax=Planobispora takensis TaxID=1367882 RepID=A0A8J3T0G8_9ACTN|nr:hypothetical protein Pta02_51040 [Planobispora takensis]